MTIEHPGKGAPSDELVRMARAHYARLTAALKAAGDDLAAGAEVDARRLADLVRDHWKALQTALNVEIELEKRNRERAGIVHGYALDLERARAEVGRRLACLKARGGDPGVS